MAKYLIHTYPKRIWYVNGYLIPSMIKQGINLSDISVYNDEKREGNLRACLSAFRTLSDPQEGTWHLQDDVIICHDFKERSEAFDEGLVCGFSSQMYDGDIEANKGYVDIQKMWFSFPCIRIPNDWAIECAEWLDKYIIGNPVYNQYTKDGVNDDWAFKLYVKEIHKGSKVLNLAPCLVDHIDYMIGGGSGVKQRKRPVRAQYWEDDYLVEELKNALGYNKRR